MSRRECVCSCVCMLFVFVCLCVCVFMYVCEFCVCKCCLCLYVCAFVCLCVCVSFCVCKCQGMCVCVCPHPNFALSWVFVHLSLQFEDAKPGKRKKDEEFLTSWSVVKKNQRTVTLQDRPRIPKSLEFDLEFVATKLITRATICNVNMHR